MCNRDCLNCEKEYCTEVYREKSLYRYRPESQKQYQKDYQKRKRDDAREKGLCIVCRKKKATRGAKCYECYIRQKRYDKAKYHNDRERWKEEGRCYYCGERVIPGKKTCKKHYAALSQRAAEMNEYKNTINARRKNKIEHGRRSD